MLSSVVTHRAYVYVEHKVAACISSYAIAQFAAVVYISLLVDSDMANY